MHAKRERNINEVNLLKENEDLLWQENEDGCKFIFKEIEDISKEAEISRVN